VESGTPETGRGGVTLKTAGTIRGFISSTVKCAPRRIVRVGEKRRCSQDRKWNTISSSRFEIRRMLVIAVEGASQPPPNQFQ
jgi:hypothetical protein